MEPATPFSVDAPVDSWMCPVLPSKAPPVSMFIAPLEPTVPADGVMMLTGPLVALELAPLDNIRLPPVSASDVAPAVIEMPPPMPLLPEPTSRVMSPPRPPAATPDVRVTPPDDPFCVTPVLSSIAPLAPMVPDAIVARTTPPLDVFVLAPLVRRTAPPIWSLADVDPAPMVTSPPAPVSPAPTKILTAPPAPPTALPDWILTVPVDPFVVPPVLRVTDPLTPSCPPLADAKRTDPLEVAVLCPLRSVRTPPD